LSLPATSQLHFIFTGVEVSQDLVFSFQSNERGMTVISVGLCEFCCPSNLISSRSNFRSLLVKFLCIGGSCLCVPRSWVLQLILRSGGCCSFCFTDFILLAFSVSRTGRSDLARSRFPSAGCFAVRVPPVKLQRARPWPVLPSARGHDFVPRWFSV
jgi:hypothetical protein